MLEAYEKDKLDRAKTNEKVLRTVGEKQTLIDKIKSRR